MPELPEVEHMTRALAGWLAGGTLGPPEARDPGFVSGDLAALGGLRVTGCRRRAKYSVVEAGPLALVLHYRMTGKVVWEPHAGDRAPRARLRLPVAGRPAVLFLDTRRLGTAWVLPSADLDAFFADRKLGPDAWPGARTGAWWAERLGGTRSAIKVALLDQRRVAGVGNIGACESLWRARIDPRARPAALSGADWQRLAEAVAAWVEGTLAAETQPEIHWVTQGGPNPFAIYGRGAAPCPRCARPLERLRQSGRTTTWCPGCQTGGRP